MKCKLKLETSHAICYRVFVRLFRFVRPSAGNCLQTFKSMWHVLFFHNWSGKKSTICFSYVRYHHQLKDQVIILSMSLELSCCDMCKFVTWLNHEDYDKGKTFFIKFQVRVHNHLWNGSLISNCKPRWPSMVSCWQKTISSNSMHKYMDVLVQNCSNSYIRGVTAALCLVSIYIM